MRPRYTKAACVEFRESIGEGRLARLILEETIEIEAVYTLGGEYKRSKNNWVRASGPLIAWKGEVGTYIGAIFSIFFALIARRNNYLFMNFCP